jgi:hypothetical protein
VPAFPEKTIKEKEVANLSKGRGLRARQQREKRTRGESRSDNRNETFQGSFTDSLSPALRKSPSPVMMNSIPVSPTWGVPACVISA